MRSTKKSPHTSPETAERILTAAVKEFAAHGFTKTTIRAIASAAGVSPGLVIHHFGSKNGLREACDDHVFTAITEAKTAQAPYMELVVQAVFADTEMRANLDYLMKALLDHSPQGQRFFDHYVGMVEKLMGEGVAGYTFRQAEDTRGQAALIAALALTPMLLSRRLEGALQTNGLEDMMTRLAPHIYELYFRGVIASEPDSTAPNEQPSPPGGQPPTPDDTSTAPGSTAPDEQSTESSHSER